MWVYKKTPVGCLCFMSGLGLVCEIKMKWMSQVGEV